MTFFFKSSIFWGKYLLFFLYLLFFVKFLTYPKISTRLVRGGGRGRDIYFPFCLVNKYDEREERRRERISFWGKYYPCFGVRGGGVNGIGERKHIRYPGRFLIPESS